MSEKKKLPALRLSVSPASVGMSQEELEARFGPMSELNDSVEEVKKGRKMRRNSIELLMEAQQASGNDTPMKDFEAFVSKRLSQTHVLVEVSEEEFARQYEMKQRLGDGATASVHIAKQREDGKEVAVKVIKRKFLLKHKSIIREVTILRKIKHPNIIELYNCYLTEKHLYLVMELASGLELFDEIIRRSCYSESDARDLVKKLLGAVAYLHEQGIAHRDLKPENILYASDEEGADIKLVDFGFARLHGDGEHADGMSTPIGTLGYKAPEVNAKRYGKAVDIWSVGVIAYILLCGFPPFFSKQEYREMDFLSSNAPFWLYMNDDTPDLQTEIQKGRISFPSPFWDSISDVAKDFVRKLIRVKKEDRLTAKQALKHPWLRADLGATATKHLIVETMNLHESLPHLPHVVQHRTRDVLQLLLTQRPSLEDLRVNGIWRSRENLDNMAVHPVYNNKSGDSFSNHSSNSSSATGIGVEAEQEEAEHAEDRHLDVKPTHLHAQSAPALGKTAPCDLRGLLRSQTLEQIYAQPLEELLLRKAGRHLQEKSALELLQKKKKEAAAAASEEKKK